MNISNDRETYLYNYNNLLGVSDRVIINIKKKEKKNKLIKVFLNGTIIVKNNSFLDESITKKIIFEKKGFNLELYFLKNRYINQYQNINKNNERLFKFYDLNIIFFKDENNLYKGIEKNDLVYLQKLENNLTDIEIDEVIQRFIKDFINDKIPIRLNNKIDIWIKIKNSFNELLKMKQCNVNLHNFLLTYEIKQIKEKIEEIELNILPLLFNEENKDNNFIVFNNSVNNLKEFLNKYNLNKNDYKIDLYFSILTLIAIIIVAILCYKIYVEFKIAFLKKIK